MIIIHLIELSATILVDSTQTRPPSSWPPALPPSWWGRWWPCWQWSEQDHLEKKKSRIKDEIAAAYQPSLNVSLRSCLARLRPNRKAWCLENKTDWKWFGLRSHQMRPEFWSISPAIVPVPWITYNWYTKIKDKWRCRHDMLLPLGLNRHGILHKPSASVRFWPKSFRKSNVTFNIFCITNYAWFLTFWQKVLSILWKLSAFLP